VNAALIKEKAYELGVDLVGIAAAERVPEADRYREWLAQGFAADMSYLARHRAKREDCRLLFPPARSVIVCGVSYHSSRTTALTSEAAASASHGLIARYARGDDYHGVLKEKLTRLVEFLQHEIGSTLETKICVDTAPLLEKVYGKYAGLGWIGKHSCLIHPRYGSWFVLGEILINRDLEYDSPMTDRCGTCRRCLTACPTGALVAPGVLDARRCLSYLTIENTGSISEEFRSTMGTSVFGCDRCQEVCPWNHTADAPDHPAFLPRPQLEAPDLDWLLAFSPETFLRIFHHSPIQRAKFQGFMRNTAIAAGNAHNPALIPQLTALRRTSPSLVIPHIEWALAQLTALQQ
jgi:epoxyqueuosine reductase